MMKLRNEIKSLLETKFFLNCNTLIFEVRKIRLIHIKCSNNEMSINLQNINYFLKTGWPKYEFHARLFFKNKKWYGSSGIYNGFDMACTDKRNLRIKLH